MFIEKRIPVSNQISLFSESIGQSVNPAIILIMGAMNQGLFWYDSFCAQLADAGLFVIRFDHRDTGFSSTVEYDKFPYDLNDLTADVLNILDAYSIAQAHVVGISMGGYIAQILGANYPNRILTLTLISTTADHRPYMDTTMGNFDNAYTLPYPKKVFLDYIEKNKKHPPQNEIEIQKAQEEGWRIMFGDISEKEFATIAELIDLSNKRSRNKYSQYNHGPAVAHSRARTELVKKITAPTHIIHGEKDPCFPIEHGQLLHALIPNSTFETLPTMGHMFSPSESTLLATTIMHFLKN